MHSFTDARGREWRYRITVAEAEEIEQVCGLDLAKVEDLQRIFAEHKPFWQITGILLHEQIAAAGLSIDDRDFKGAFDGDVLEAATTALIEELLFFSPSLRPLMKKLLPAVRRRLTAKVDRMVQQIDAGDLDDRIDPSAPSSAATGSPASPA